MKLRIKILPSEKNEWLGWFGEDVIKLRLKTSNIQNKEILIKDFIDYLNKDLGIQSENIKTLEIVKNFIIIELPDIAWELFLTIIPNNP